MVNSYQLAEETEFSIVYGSKMTHELSARGVKGLSLVMLGQKIKDLQLIQYLSKIISIQSMNVCREKNHDFHMILKI